MTKDDTGRAIQELRKKIRRIQEELSQMDGHVPDIPELIITTNILRTNEQLTRIDSKKSELLKAYGQYTQILTDVIRTIIKKQNEIAEMRKKQARTAQVGKGEARTTARRRKNTAVKK